MSLYPSLEDMTVGKMAQAQVSQGQAAALPPSGATTVTTGGGATVVTTSAPGLYPNLAEEYMGLQLTGYTPVRPPPPPGPGGAVVPSGGSAVAKPSNSGAVTGVANVGIRRAEIKQGVKEVVVCKDQKGKCGVSFFAVSKGIFVCFVQRGSPAAMAGLRFGDQILTINGEVLAGYSSDKASKLIKKAASERISLAVRERPFERTIVMQKDSGNHVGFSFNNGEIKAIVKDSSAARNGILIDHYLTEVNGQNVIGLKDKDIGEVFNQSPRTVTITIMPSFVYKHMMTNMGSALRKAMDHSIPDV